MINKWYKVYFVLIAVFLLVMGGLTVFLPQKEFSENENRYLNQFPEFAWDSLWKGEYQEKLQEAVSDQTIRRDIFTAIATFSERALGYRDIGGVYLGKDGYYISKKTEQDIDKFRYLENLRYVEYLSEQREEGTVLMLIPSAGTVLRDQLPAWAPFYRAESMYQAAEMICTGTQVLDIREELRQQNLQTPVFFRTDHHWTLPGAYIGYSAFCEQQDLQKHSYGFFQPEKVTDSFYGTLYSRVLDQTVRPDSLYAAGNLPEIQKVTFDGTVQKGIYCKDKLEEKDKYGYFFGGNYGEVTIRMNSDTGRKLLVIKDSFANSMVPFLLENYDEVTMIDLRYYRQSVRKLLEQKADDEVLIVYEMSNFAEDANLYKLSR